MTLCYAQEKPSSHEPEKRAREVVDGIYAKKPEEGWHEKLQESLKLIRDKDLEGELGFKIKSELGADIYTSFYWLIEKSLPRIESELKKIKDKLKSPIGATQKDKDFYQKKDKLIAFAKQWDEYNRLIGTASRNLSKLSVGRELCHSIYAKEPIDVQDESFFDRERKKDYENNAGVKFTLKASDGSYYTLCSFPYGSKLRPKEFVLHFNKDLKLEEVFQGDSGYWVPVDFSLNTKKVQINKDTTVTRIAFDFSEKKNPSDSKRFYLSRQHNSKTNTSDHVVLGRDPEETFEFDHVTYFNFTNEFYYPKSE